MINEQINLALTELLKMNFGFAELGNLFSFKNNSNDKLYRYEYSFDEAAPNNKLKSFISAAISDQAIKHDCVVFHQANSIRVEKKIHSR